MERSRRSGPRQADVETDDDHAWCTGVASALADLRDAWHVHAEFTEDRDGLFVELLEDNVEVAAPEVDHLRRDHVVAGRGHDPGRGAARRPRRRARRHQAA